MSATPLEPLEHALGLVLGRDAPVPLPAARDPLAALEVALLPALRRSPCLVSFSGGRDSSAVLATAAALARREGLPDPIPATIRARGAAAAEESAWQELVVSHLGISDWMRLEVDDELDVVGPVAQRVLYRHGLLWPFNAHFHLPLLEAASGGALLTGIGGDELFAAVASRRAPAVLAGRVRPQLRDARRIALHLAPRPLRAWWHRREPVPFEWLTAEGRRAATGALAVAAAEEPRRMTARTAFVRRARYLRVGTGALAGLAGDAAAEIVHPLLAPGVRGAVAAAAPRGGHLARSDGMRALFGALLPGELLARGDKACFDEVFFNRHSRAFAEHWSGGGMPAGLVDDTALAAHWRGGAPRAQSFTLLQAAWLASAGDRVEQAAAGVGERVPSAGPAQPPHGQ